MKALNGVELNGKKLEVLKHEKKDKTKAAEPATTVLKNNLFVKNLPENTDDAKLTAMFAQYGAIESATVQRSE